MKRLIILFIVMAGLFGQVVHVANFPTDAQKNLYIVPGNGGADAFGRFRVSSPQTLIEAKLIHDNQALVFDYYTNGAGVATYQNAHSAVLMTVSNNGEYVIAQTKSRANYQPGKSLEVIMSFRFGAGSAGVNKKVGYFNTATNAPFTNLIDGLYIEQDGVNVYLVQAKNGTPERVHQTNWDDPLDGNGRSKITLDWSKTQIIVWSIEWLGVGSVEAALVVDGHILPFYKFKNANTKTAVYMQTPNHSMRYEIRSTGGTNNLMQICGSVSSEGGLDRAGAIRGVSTEGAAITLTNENINYALIGIRLKTNYLGLTVFLESAQIQIQTASEKMEWSLVLNPTITGTPIWNDLANSGVQYVISSNGLTATGGTLVGGGFLETGGVQSGGGSLVQAVEDAIRLGATIDGVRDTIFLMGRPVGGTAGIEVDTMLFWREQL